MIYGTLLDVHTDTVGEPLTANAAATATSISVTDATTFREEGGLVKIGQDVYTYTAIDTDLNTLTLASGLLRAVVTDDLVEVYPTQQTKRAFVDTGIEGDTEGVWATIPQTMVLTLPDGLRYEGQRETVLLQERSPGHLVISDVTAAANVAASTVLPQGSVEPQSLQVGVTGNLVQDPDFNRDVWGTPPRSWTVSGPDTVYTESNFARSIGDPSTNAGWGPGEDLNTWSWWLTDLVPVDPGRQVRISALARRDAASLTGGTGQVRVCLVFYKNDRTTAISDSTMVSTLILATDMVADTWTPISVVATAPEGYTYVKAGIQQRLQTTGTVDLIKPEVQILWNRVQSADYDPGVAGWNLDTDQSQVENLNVLVNLGANNVSARTVTVDGQDLETGLLAPLPSGAVAYDSSATGGNIHTASIGATETITHVFSFGPLMGGRAYRMAIRGAVSGTVSGDIFELNLRFTSNGVTPTTASPLLAGGVHRLVIPATPAITFNLWCILSPGSDVASHKTALSLKRVTGTGTAILYQTEAGRRLDWTVEDLGVYAIAATAGTLAQKSYSDATPAQADPPSTYVTSWLANWSRSYDGNTLATLAGDPAALYQGYYSAVQGNTRSLFGFDYAAIQTALTGATLVKAELTYRIQHVWRSYLANLYVGSHNYTTKPSTWNTANVNEQRWSFATQIEGSTYTQDITAVAAEFQAGTTRGLAFGPTLTDVPQNWGYMYGGTTDPSRPKLTITYRK